MDTYVIEPKDEKAVLAYELYVRADRGLYGSSSSMYYELSEDAKALFRTLGDVFFGTKRVDTENYSDRTEALLNSMSDDDFFSVMSCYNFSSREQFSDNIRSRLIYLFAKRTYERIIRERIGREANENSR